MIADVKKSAEQKMQKSLEALKVDLSKVRSGRAHTGFLDHVTVDYYGAPTPINQVANINLIDARTIGVIPWEKKMANAIEKAIRESDLGLNPMSVGETIRVLLALDAAAAGEPCRMPLKELAGFAPKIHLQTMKVAMAAMVERD